MDGFINRRIYGNIRIDNHRCRFHYWQSFWNNAVQVTNSVTSPFTVNRIKVNGENADIWSSGTSNIVNPGSNENFTIRQPIATGNKYAISLYDIDNTMICAHTAKFSNH